MRPMFHGTLIASSVPDAARQGKGKQMSGLLRRRRPTKELGANDPRPCYQVSLVRKGRQCWRCGEIPDVVHIPTVHIGYFCSKCCPACGPVAS